MDRLDLKVPPPVVALVCAILMWLAADHVRSLAFTLPARPFASALLAAAGAFCDLSGFLAFRRGRTTINPLKPHDTSTIVSDGIYRHTRNPMYLGLLFFLSAWAIWLGNALSVAVLPVFAGYLTRFQIIPEECILAGKFGNAYTEYRQRVPRWF